MIRNSYCKHLSFDHMKAGETALMWAAGAGNLDIVSRLIDFEANVNASDKVRVVNVSH